MKATLKTARTWAVRPEPSNAPPTAEEYAAAREEVRKTAEHMIRSFGSKFDRFDLDELKNGDMDPFLKAVLNQVAASHQVQRMSSRNKKDNLAARLSEKRGAAKTEDDIIEGIIGARVIDQEKWKDNQLGGIDTNDWMDFSLQPSTCAWITIKCTCKMLLLTSLLAVVNWLIVASVPFPETELHIFSGNATDGDDADASTADAEPTIEPQTIMYFVIVGGTSITLANAFTAMTCSMTHARSYVLIFMPLLIFVPSFLLYFEFGGSVMRGPVFGGIFCGFAAASTATFSYEFMTEENSDNGRDRLGLAQRRAEAKAAGKVWKKKSRKEKAKLAFLLAQMSFFTTGVVFCLAVGILSMYNVYESTSWKVFVTGFAWVIKVTGNKFLLFLIQDKLAMFIADTQIFGYEYATALLLRILQLSIPDPTTAQLVSLISAIGEMAARIFFFNLFLKRGLKQKTMNKEEKRRYAVWGKLRVQDASNDMVVEYLSSISGGLFMIFLAPSGLFTFSTATAIPKETILVLVAYQLIPELFIDFYVTGMECFSGLRVLHESYWKLDTGALKNSNKWAWRIGDLVKASLLKILTQIFITMFVVAVCIK
ncbi:hypothetical protein TeGR_g11241 [Tetraparma gracilis]|uniref:Uncharacterized protein n=1 Tax=Tetraparma gracilis TaxID=2962635 RepID=A0ABQ6MS53_9STRA|nr:hypothetical protein TeGR_g11241 [Tetraparma gracilis]